MSTTRLTLPLLTNLFLCSCASTVPVSGSTRAGDVLKQDTMRRLVARARFDAQCHQVDAIQTRIIAEHPAGWTAGTAGCQAHGCVEERWEAHLCGKSVAYRVTFTPDGEGGTYFSVAPWKKTDD